MTAEIISVGTEILLGQIVDTNAAFLAQTLAGLGIGVYQKVVVGDNAERLGDAIRSGFTRADIVILGGGLGPTKDDLTKETVAQVLCVRLVNDPTAEERLRSFFVQRHILLPETNLKQALVFEGGTVFQNENGTAPGLAITIGGKTIACLPGPPHEFKPMVLNSLVPYLRAILGPEHPILVSRTIKLSGIGESIAAERVNDLLDGDNPTVAPYAKMGEVHLRITAKALSAEAAAALIDPVDREIASRIGEFIIGRDDETLESNVLSRLGALGWTLSGAESCTGGQISDRLTAIPGCSSVFRGCAVTYSNQAKMDILGVGEATLAEHGAVSREVALEMATGARRAYRADAAYSVTGIAGPEGGTPQKPVGTVWVAIETPNGTVARQHLFRGGREAIRRFTSQAALTLLREELVKSIRQS